MAVVLSVRMEKVCVIRTFDADGPEKMFVFSKVRVTVVRLNRIIFDWTECLANHLTGKLMFVLTSWSSYPSSS